MAKQGRSRAVRRISGASTGGAALGKQIPFGWTDEGMPRGWIVPARSPQDGRIQKLQAENEQLKATLEDVLARLEKLEAANGAQSTG